MMAASCCKMRQDEQHANYLNASDREFVIAALRHNDQELVASTVGADHSTYPPLTEFCDLMHLDAIRATDSLKSSLSGLDIVLPGNIDSTDYVTVQKVTLLSDKDFDSAFIQVEINIHHKMRWISQSEIDSGENKRVVGYARTYLRTIEEHLRKLDSLYNSRE